MAVTLKRCGPKRYGLFYKSIITENEPDIKRKWAGNGREREEELEKREQERGEELEKSEKKIEKKSGEICICENFVVNLQPITNWGGLSNKGVV